MAGLQLILLISLVSCASAFSLNNNRVSKPALSKVGNFVGKASPMMMASDAAPVDVVASKEQPNKTFLQKIWNDQTQLMTYLAVWYMGNIYYNIYNKKACIALGKNAAGASNAHWALSAVQLLVGVLFVVPFWLTGIRKSPELTMDNWKELSPVGLWASLAHAFSVLALGAGAVSFAQIVKAAEPVFAAATNALLLKDIDHPMVYAALLPIIGGVGLASLKEMSFTWTALIAASLANQAAAFKNVVSKGVMKKPWAKGLGPQNTYAVVTLLALIATLPFVAFFDAKDFVPVWETIKAAGKANEAIKYSVLSGL